MEQARTKKNTKSTAKRYKTLPPLLLAKSNYNNRKEKYNDEKHSPSRQVFVSNSKNPFKSCKYLMTERASQYHPARSLLTHCQVLQIPVSFSAFNSNFVFIFVF